MPDLDVFMAAVEHALDDLGFKTRWWRRRYHDWYRQDFLAEARHAGAALMVAAYGLGRDDEAAGEPVPAWVKDSAA